LRPTVCSLVGRVPNSACTPATTLRITLPCLVGILSHRRAYGLLLKVTPVITTTVNIIGISGSS